MKVALWVVLILGLFGTFAGAQDYDLVEKGRAWTKQYYEGDFQTVWSKFSSELRREFPNADSLRVFHRKMQEDFGAELEVSTETTHSLGDSKVYSRVTRFEKTSLPVLVQWTVDSRGQVAGLVVRAVSEAGEAPSEFLDYSTQARLKLPFKGQWAVLWGGRTITQNIHASMQDQRFACDFVVAKEGRTHPLDATANAEFYSWDQPVCSPGDGTVKEVVNQIEDNLPGSKNSAQILGNYIVIDHGYSEFSILAHLRKGSAKVKVGDYVRQGEPIASCGNSGNVSEPQLHYHLQNGPEISKAKGLPAFFEDYYANGNLISRGEPTHGQIVESKD
jgi:hypothetical protein